jgi:hypothetical protein
LSKLRPRISAYPGIESLRITVLDSDLALIALNTHRVETGKGTSADEIILDQDINRILHGSPPRRIAATAVETLLRYATIIHWNKTRNGLHFGHRGASRKCWGQREWISTVKGFISDISGGLGARE